MGSGWGLAMVDVVTPVRQPMSSDLTTISKLAIKQHNRKMEKPSHFPRSLARRVGLMSLRQLEKGKGFQWQCLRSQQVMEVA